MNLADEIRQQMEKNKGLKLAVGEINNHLSILEGLVRKDIMEQVDEAYQRGLEDGKAVHDKGCEGCKWEGDPNTYSPCERCCNCYKNEWTAKDDKIEVGDWVNIKNTDEELGIVTKEHGNQFYILWADGSSGLWSSKGVVKTGRHFDIDKILDEMKGMGTDDDTY